MYNRENPGICIVSIGSAIALPPIQQAIKEENKILVYQSLPSKAGSLN